MSSNPSARLEKLRWPVMIVKLRKGQKHSKILKTIANFNKILLKANALKTLEPFHCLKKLSSITISCFNFKLPSITISSFTVSKTSINLEHDNNFS